MLSRARGRVLPVSVRMGMALRCHVVGLRPILQLAQVGIGQFSFFFLFLGGGAFMLATRAAATWTASRHVSICAEGGLCDVSARYWKEALVTCQCVRKESTTASGGWRDAI
jgi:hypothetical protein